MEKTIFLFFLCTAVMGNTRKHFFVEEHKTWVDAVAYCRQHYTDLSFIGSQSDQDKFLSDVKPDVSQNITWGWIGLHQDTKNLSAWKWSGGANMTYKNWGVGQPDNFVNTENSVNVMSNGKWNDFKDTNLLPFYCIYIPKPQVTMSWEEALEHCRETLTDLISLASTKDRFQVLSKIQHNHITERVWIGLRYLQDRWLWVDGEPLVFQTWLQGGDQDHQCPLWKRCGALTKSGQWESWDCQKKLNFICK